MITPGNRTLNGVTLEAVKAKIRTVASGVLVMLVKVADIKLITIRVGTNEDDAIGNTGRNADTNACAKGAAFASRGNMTPPGNPPAEANAMAMNLATPT